MVWIVAMMVAAGVLTALAQVEANQSRLLARSIFLGAAAAASGWLDGLRFFVSGAGAPGGAAVPAGWGQAAMAIVLYGLLAAYGLEGVHPTIQLMLALPVAALSGSLLSMLTGILLGAPGAIPWIGWLLPALAMGAAAFGAVVSLQWLSNCLQRGRNWLAPAGGLLIGLWLHGLPGLASWPAGIIDGTVAAALLSPLLVFHLRMLRRRAGLVDGLVQRPALDILRAARRPLGGEEELASRRRRVMQGEVLGRLRKLILESERGDQLLQAACEMLIDARLYDQASISRLNAGQTSIERMAYAGGDAFSEEAGAVDGGGRRAASNVISQALHGLHPVVRRASSVPPDHQGGRSGPRQPGLRYEAAIPIRTDDGTSLALSLQTGDPEAFEGEEGTSLLALADELALGLKRLEREGRDRHRLDQRTRLFDLTQAALAADDIASLLQVIPPKLADLFGADRCTVSLSDEALDHELAGLDPEVTSSLARQPGGPSGPAAARVLEGGRPLVLEDLASSGAPGSKAPMPSGSGALLALPLIVGGQKLGAALISYRAPHAFGPEEMALAEQAATTVALAVAKMRTLDSEARRIRQLESIRQAGLGLSARLDLDAVLDTVLAHALSLVEADDAHIFFYERSRLTFAAARWAGSDQKTAFSEPRENGLTYTVARRGEPVIVSDAGQHPLFAGENWNGAIIGLPLRIGGCVRGVMNVAFDHAHDFTADELRVLNLLADQAVFAMQNARLFQSIDADRRRVKLLYDVIRELGTSLVPRDILQSAITLTTRAVGGTSGTAYLFDQRHQRLKLTAIHRQDGMTLEALEPVLDWNPGQGLDGWVAKHHEAALVEDVSRDPRWATIAGLEEDRGSAISVPVMRRDELLGVMTVLSRDRLDDDHRLLMEAISRQVALALSNATSYQDAQRQLAELRALQRIAWIAGHQLELDPLLDEICACIVELFGAPRVEVYLIEDEAFVMRGTSHGLAEDPPRMSIDRGPFSQMVSSASPLLIMPQDPLADWLGRRSGDQGLALSPLMTAGVVIGALAVEAAKDGNFDSRDLQLLALICNQISVAVENATLYERLRRHARELEQVVEGRTAALARALEQARQAEQLKTRFVADVSHELRTPLTNIHLYLELLQTGNPERVAEYTDTLKRETDRLVALIEDLLAISRLDTGAAAITLQHVRLDEMARGLAQDRSRLFKEQGLSLSFENRAERAEVLADERMLQQVVANLMTNALRYTPGGGRVEIRVDGQKREGHDYVTLTVSDTGLGIPEDEIPMLFERFFRGAASRRMGTPGTGLGLSICKEILERHGGMITVTSRENQGSAFTIWLQPAPAAPVSRS
jgi:signal transduction histidine kinase